MKIILRERVKNLGDIGDIVEVKDGYARNYLIPKGFAIPATKSAIKVVEQEKKKKLKQREEQIKKYQEIAKKYEGLEIEIPVKVDENEHMYGSVTARIIADKLKEMGYELDRHVIVLDNPIKELGIYEVVLSFMPEVETKIKVKVVKDETGMLKEEEKKEAEEAGENKEE